METISEKPFRGSRILKVLLDTTYYLPLISVNIDGIPDDLLKRLLQDKKYQLYYCEITLFELAAKGTKLSLSNNSLTIHDIIRGLDSIRWDKRLIKLSWCSHPLIMELAIEIRKFHSDFIDCLILATAVCYTDIIALFDKRLFEVVSKNRSIIEKIREINEKFCFWFTDLSADPIQINIL